MRKPLVEKLVTLDWPSPESADEIRSRLEHLKEFNADGIRVTVREFRYNVQQLLELNIPVIVQTRRGRTLGVYAPLGRKRPTPDELRKAIEALKQ